MQKLPVGIQDFAQLRERGFAYVDKTVAIDELIEQGASPQRALAQIEAKGYADAWYGRGKVVHRVDSQARGLSDWAIADD